MKIILSALLVFSLSLSSVLLNAQTKANENSRNLNISDFTELTQKKDDDRIVIYRKGNIQYTMIPLRDLWLSEKRKEAFEVSLQFLQKLSAVWLAKGYGINLEHQMGYMNEELQRKTADEIRNLAMQNGIRPGLPTTKEIIERSMDSKVALARLKERSAFLVQYDEMIEAFQKSQDEVFQLEESGLSDYSKRIVPTAIMGVVGVKISTGFLDKLKSVKWVGGIAPYLNGSLTLTPIVRPWYVVATNLDTGKVTEESWYMEATLQGWISKDIQSNKLITNGGAKLGLGLLWGDYGRISDIGGFTAGYSKNISLLRAIGLDPTHRLPLTTSLRLGAITANADTFTKMLDPATFLKNGYAMVTRQIGGTSFTEQKGIFDYGYSTNIVAITDSIKMNAPTLDSLLKEVIDYVPGAEIILDNNEIKIKLPKEATDPKISEVREDLEVLKNQVRVHGELQNRQPTLDKQQHE